MILCAGANETFPFARTIGIGLIQSSINLTQICLENNPTELIFIGSAGNYGEYKTFDIVESSSAANIELSFLNDDSFTPLENIIKNKNENYRNDTIVNSSNYISTNERLAKKFKQYEIGIENMEFFAICSVAKKFNIPVLGIFIITNDCNKNAHEDFLANHKKAMLTLVEYLEEKKLIEKNT